MNLRTEPVTGASSNLQEVSELYIAAFPDDERDPLEVLLEAARKSPAQFLAYYDGDLFVGFTFAAQQKDLVFLDYLAVNIQAQSKGYGSRILQQLEAHHPGCRIALEIEERDDTAPNAVQRCRRFEFYKKNGYEYSGLKVLVCGITYEILVKNGSCTTDELIELSRSVFGEELANQHQPCYFNQ
jgi:GNAT superfamily N-acetyltransferase